MSSPTDIPGGQPSKKVLASTIGAGGGAVTASFVLYLVDQLFFGGRGEVPVEVSAFVLFWVTGLVTFAAGYITPRGLEEVAPFVRRGDHEARP